MRISEKYTATQRTVDFISDPYNPCRECGGVGTTSDPTDDGKTLTETCWQCGGSGSRSIRVTTGEDA